MDLPCENAVETPHPFVVGCKLGLFDGAPHVIVCAKHCGHCRKDYVPPGVDAAEYLRGREATEAPCCEPPKEG